MALTKLQQLQARQSHTFDDTLPPGSGLQTGSVDLEADLNAIRSQLRRIIDGVAWFDDLANVSGHQRNLKDLSIAVQQLLDDESAEVTSAKVAFTFSSPAVIDFGDLPSGSSIVVAQVIIDQPFNDASTLLSLGLASNPDSILPTNTIDPTHTSTYQSDENFLVTVADDALRLKIQPFSSTQGSGRVVVLYAP